MADREITVQSAQLLLVEDLRHEPHIAQGRQPTFVGDRNPGRLLAAVLEREQAEVSQTCDVALGRPDSEQPAHQA